MGVEKILIDKLLKDICKERVISKIYAAWKNQNENNDRFSTYLKNKKYNCVAIYGLGKIGQDLYYELIKDGIEISFLADRFNHKMYDGREVLGICDVWPHADAVIITQITDIEDGYRDIREKYDGSTISFTNYMLGRQL